MKNNLLKFVLVPSLVALIVGLTVAVLFNYYISLGGQSMGFSGELNLNRYGYMSPNFIIQEPRKVVVNQDLKVEETITGIKSSLLGVYLKNEDSSDSYDLNKPFAQALAATTDGWVMAIWPKSIKANEVATLVSNYTLVDSNKKIYEIEQAEVFPAVDGLFVFFKLKNSSGLQIKRLVNETEIKLGQSILLATLDGSFFLDYLSSKASLVPVFSSDVYPYNFILNSGLRQEPTFAFNLSGDLIGVLDYKGKWLVSTDLDAYWRSMFKFKRVAKASLGVNYINLSDFIKSDWEERGALIESFSPVDDLSTNPAILAGLKVGDVITKINGIEIDANNSLSVLISAYDPGDRIFLHYLRAGIETEIAVTLGFS